LVSRVAALALTALSSHPVDALFANLRSEYAIKSVPPLPHGLVADVDAAFNQEVFDVPRRQGALYIHHNHKADHFG
jgi:hypothetical protein